MGLLKRAVASIARRIGKTMMLLILVFVLGSLIAGGISIQRAVISTEENLRQSMPPITAIEFDESQWMEYVNQTGDRYEQPENLTADLVRQIGDLPYVSQFNYSISSALASFDFESYTPEIQGDTGSDGMEDWPNWFTLLGVSRPEIIYIEQGLFELVAGRTFEESEMGEVLDVIPIVLSHPWASTNNLSVGSTFTVDHLIGNHFEHHGPEAFHVDNLAFKETYTFEVIGLFDIVDRRTDLSMNVDEDWNEWNAQWGQLNRAFIPSHVAEEINRFSFEIGMELAIEFGRDDPWFNPDEAFEDSWEARIETLFILEDSLQVDYFRAAVEPLIPDYYRVADLSNTFANMQSSMETLLWIADVVLIVAITATVLILSLIITLFLRDRRYEMGIYLALGEKKSKVISQIIFEVAATSIIGLTLAVFVGNITSSQISQAMLRNQLASMVEPEARIMGFGASLPSLETSGFFVEMSPDEMMESFDVTLNGQTIGLLYGIGITTVIVSTLVPVVYVTRLNPKKILMEAKS